MSPTPPPRPPDARVRLPRAETTPEFRARLEERCARDGFTVSHVLRSLVELYVDGKVTVDDPPADDLERADLALEVGRLVRGQGVSLYAASQTLGVTWPRAKRLLALYDEMPVVVEARP